MSSNAADPETTSIPARILYIHGFNSSPASHKAQALWRYCRRHAPHLAPVIPRLSHEPARAMEQLREAMEAGRQMPALVVGSSLGGYYATWLSEHYGVPAALVNPAVAPHRHLGEELLGRHVNPFSGEVFEMTREHAGQLAHFEVKELAHPERFLLLVQTGDEVLDYRLAVEKYAGSRQVVQPGGDHSFVNFEDMIPRILGFGALTQANARAQRPPGSLAE